MQYSNYMMAPGLIENAIPIKHEMNLDFIMDCVAEACKISKERIKLKSRKNELVMARHLFSLLARELTRLPLKAIAGYLGKDHTTIISSVKVYHDLMDTDKQYINLYNRAKLQLS